MWCVWWTSVDVGVDVYTSYLIIDCPPRVRVVRRGCVKVRVLVWVLVWNGST